MATKKTAVKKKPAKSPAKKFSAKKAVKPTPANRASKKSPVTKEPSGHGVSKLETKPARVEELLKILRDTYPTPAAMAAAPIEALEDLIRTTGFYHNKAKSISGAAKGVVERFGGKVPQTMDELLSLPGVARKTGNVVLGTAYGIADGIVVDTHVLRLSRRLELTLNTEPKKVEQDLIKIIPKDHWIVFSHELILHGRAICIARRPRCADCTIERECDSSDKKIGRAHV